MLLSVLCIMSQQRMLEVMSSEDEDDLFSSDEKGEHDVLYLFVEVVGQSSPGTLVERVSVTTRNLRGQL